MTVSRLDETAVSLYLVRPLLDIILTFCVALHFKLAVENIEEADSYEDVLFTYRPQIHPDRDGDLMDMLPDYLGGEISFPRHQASKFYAKVMKYLTERPE